MKEKKALQCMTVGVVGQNDLRSSTMLPVCSGLSRDALDDVLPRGVDPDLLVSPMTSDPHDNPSIMPWSRIV